jgi:hypothetical protein
MSTLSEVSILIGRRARDIEKARDVFTTDIRAFVRSILAAVRRIRSEPWTTARVRVDLPRDIENETRLGSELSTQYAFARAELRFKKGTRYVQIAELRFGIEFDESAQAFAWQVTLVPNSRYNRIDDIVWHGWRTQPTQLPGARHMEKANTVLLAARPLGAEVVDNAFNDVKSALEFLLTIESPLGDAVGFDAAPGED